MKANKQNVFTKHRHLDGDIWYCGNPKCGCVIRKENSTGMNYKYDVCPKCGKEVEYED